MRKLLSNLYGAVVGIRNVLYNHGILLSYLTPPVVVSIGNIEVGGTGKTPFTITLAQHLQKRGHRVAIITRGYRGKLKGTMLVNKNDTAGDVGDEALIMAQISGVPVIKSPNRCDGAMFASRELHAAIVLLDDGFQHRKIHRDLDIVLISRDIYSETLLPFGRLREPSSALDRADILVSTKNIFLSGLTASLTARDLVDLHGNSYDLSLLAGKRVLAFCGIARPETFFDSIRNLSDDVDCMHFRDHHNYTKRDIRQIIRRSKRNDMVLTTQKDMVKLKPLLSEEPWYALRVSMHIPDADYLIQEIENIVKNRRISR